MKQVIFNVGGALSSYTEFENKKLIIDIGKSSDFNPIIDFLLPLFNKRNSEKLNDKYRIDQLIISHPHNDHISCIEDFNKHFYTELLTCPNNNNGMEENEKINWSYFDNCNSNIKLLKEMLIGRNPPLKPTCDGKQFIFYIPPKICEETDELLQESYCNNISLAVFLIIKNHRVFFPGDLQKNGMKELIEKKYHLGKDTPLLNKLNGGVDILITPHHGLQSSFSTTLFDSMKENKTRCLNIVSEKVNTDDNRNIDSRYSTSDYCIGKNNLGNSEEKHYQLKTSHGHIFIDYNYNDYPHITIISDNKELINKFYSD